MKQNITLSLDTTILKKVRAAAAARGLSVSAMLADDFMKKMEEQDRYQRAMKRAIARMENTTFSLGGEVSRTARRYMTARVFVDSNVLVYAHDREAGQKQKRANEWLRQLWREGAGCLSTQVLQEFYANTAGKRNPRLTFEEARNVIRDFTPWVLQSTTADTVIRGSEISEI